MGDNPSRFKSPKNPVERVSHDDVTRFCQRLSERSPELDPTLPTEAQWEYACRAGSTTPFHFGDSIDTDQVNYHGSFPYGDQPKGEFRQTTVGVKELPANRWGLFQLHGNVWEWCRDWYGKYETSLNVDPEGPSAGSDRVLRGGSWFHDARSARSAYRYADRPGLSLLHPGLPPPEFSQVRG